ncbi:MAG: phospho-sugar mutase [Planctomycetota bacterium]|nr:phospho-sugar mutase [Planctomycetota bacterium]
MATSTQIQSALNKTQQATAEGKISSGALENITCWLTQDRYEHYVPAVLEHIESGKWQALDDVFWTIIPFGTGGRRGRMVDFGSNAINDRTIGESAQGLAETVLSLPPDGKPLSCAIAYDTRHKSRHFAELCASIMVANGFHVYFLDDYRATPQLSFAVRQKNCSCGIMVTASHNPPSDNAVKVYWSTGGQVLPPHDSAIIDRVMNVQQIKTVSFADALSQGKVSIVTQEIDDAYLAAAGKFAWPGPRDIRVMYSPLHGVGGFAVLPLLKNAGFNDLLVYGPHSKPDGDFPNVPGHVSNPENAIVFDAIILEAKKQRAEIILATDPDCDRMGCACPATTKPDSPWATINGNQLGALLTDFVLGKLKQAGKITNRTYVIKTLVTTDLIRRIAESYGVICQGNIQVGFKWIAGLMDACGPDDFAFGTEESHGFLIGQYARDKDGPVACLLMCQLAADLKAKGITLHQRLDQLQIEHGCHLEDLINVQMEGSEGMANMKKLMQSLRDNPPAEMGGLKVLTVRDYGNLTRKVIGGSTEALDSSKSNMLILDLALPGQSLPSGNAIAVRPSGTEPKVKFYLFGVEPVASADDLDLAKKTVSERIAKMKSDAKRLA